MHIAKRANHTGNRCVTDLLCTGSLFYVLVKIVTHYNRHRSLASTPLKRRPFATMTFTADLVRARSLLSLLVFRSRRAVGCRFLSSDIGSRNVSSHAQDGEAGLSTGDHEHHSSQHAQQSDSQTTRSQKPTCNEVGDRQIIHMSLVLFTGAL